MSPWFVSAGVLLVATVPLWIVLVRDDTASRLVALEVFGVQCSLALICLAEGFNRSVYADLALVLAVMSGVGALTFAHFLERDL